MDNNNIIVLNFGESKLPVFKETRSSDWIKMDEDDTYPSELIRIFNNSSKHNSIVTGKAGYIFGKGLKAETETPKEQAWLNSVNRYGQSANDLVKKAILDIEIFSGTYLQIIPSAVGFELYKLDFNKVRICKSGDGFWFKANGNWSDRKERAVFFPKYYKGIQQPAIFAYYEYRPGTEYYPLPGYVAAFNYLEADIEVSRHVLANSQGGFSASKFINFYNGEPEENKKKAIEKLFTNKFTGADGKKIVIGFNTDPAKRPTIDDLGTSDLTKEDFAQVDKLIEQNIYAGHRVTTPILFGIKTEGQLGGRNEMREGYEIFTNTYVNEKQQNIEQVINMFASELGLSKITLVPTEPIGFEFSEATLLAVAPKKYILDKIGIDPTLYPEAAQPTVVPGEENMQVNDNLKNLTGKQYQHLQRIIREFSKGKLTREQAALMLRSSLGLTDEDINVMLGAESVSKFAAQDDDKAIQAFSEVGEHRDNFLVLKSRKVKFSSNDEAFEDELNQVTQDFKSEVTDREAKVLEVLKKDKRATPEVIAKAVKVTVEEAANLLSSIEDKGLIKTSTVTEHDTEVKVRELQQPVSEVTDKEQRVEILIRYSYEGPKDERNRAFCAKLLALDRFYSRVDIELISERLGYSVWDRRGGFWNDGGTVKPYCRHHWKSNVVLKKRK